MGYRRNNRDSRDRDGRDNRRRVIMKGQGRTLKSVELDYKKPDALRQFLDDFGRIRPRRQTRLNATAQRRLAREVKRARHLALLPFVDG